MILLFSSHCQDYEESVPIKILDIGWLISQAHISSSRAVKVHYIYIFRFSLPVHSIQTTTKQPKATLDPSIFRLFFMLSLRGYVV